MPNFGTFQAITIWFIGISGLLLHKSHVWSCRKPPFRSSGRQTGGI